MEDFISSIFYNMLKKSYIFIHISIINDSGSTSGQNIIQKAATPSSSNSSETLVRNPIAADPIAKYTTTPSMIKIHFIINYIK